MSGVQLRLAHFLGGSKKDVAPAIAKTTNAKKRRRNAPETPSDLVLSEEMVHWIETTVQERDEDGYLVENISSILSKPMDSMSVFCPTGDLITSKTTAIRPPAAAGLSDTGKSYSRSSRSRVSMISTATADYSEDTEERLIAESDSKPKHIQAAIDRLNVMWLKRKAALEEQEGFPERAFDTLQEAINIHVGSDCYETANMTDYVMASDPHSLMEQIEDNYFTYDVSAHKIATKLQQWLHRCFMVRVRAAVKIQSFFRGFLVRDAKWRRNHLFSHCAVLIQRRFRKHLKKMHALATKIKAWYRGQVALRDYRAKLRIYKAARKIQCLFRGNQGREVAARKHLIRESVRKIQRRFRAFVVRRNRLFGIVTFHKMFYIAARRLQTWFRRFMAIKRSQRKLISEMMREEDRVREESEVLQRTIQVEMSRIQLYLETAAGKLHLEGSRAYVKAKDDRFERMRHTLTKAEILTHEASIVFELYDTDGSGSIDLEELTYMIRDLCIPLSKAAIAKLALELDKDGGGDIDFSEFLDWYSGGGGVAAAKEAGLGAGIFTTLLKSRRYALELTGQTLARRCARDVARQFCSWLSRETKTLFRNTRPPKFQCCQCMQPFVLFMDYFMHFNKSGNCMTVDQKGMFFPKYWIMSEWHKQRECEKEVMRVKDEYPFLQHKALVAVYEDLSIQKDPGVASTIKMQVAAAERMFHNILNPKPKEPDPDADNETDLEPPAVPDTVDLIMDIVDICKDGYLSPNVAKYVATCIGSSLPGDWLLNDRWPMSQFKSWVKVNTQNIRDQSVGCCLPCSMTSCKGTILCRPTQRSISEAKLLGTIFVGCLRILQVGAETSLVALTAFRSRRPRKLRVKDKELEKVGLSNVTKVAYKETREAIVRRLRLLQIAKNKLYLETVQSQASCFSFCRRFGKKDGSYAPIGPEEMNPAQMKALQIEEAHVRADAEFGRKLLTSPGRSQLTRTTNELWAFKHILFDQLHNGKKSKLHDAALIEYTYDIFAGADCCKFHDDTPCFSAHDIKYLLSHLLLKTNEKSIASALNYLDPDGTGYISYENFHEFMSSRRYCELSVFIRPVRWFFRHAYRRLLARSYYTEAKIAMLIRTRQECRLKSTINNTLLDAILNWSERRLIEYFEDFGVMPGENSPEKLQLDLLRAVNSRNEHRLICRMAEDEAERTFKPKLWKTSKGRDMVQKELLLLNKSSFLTEGYGYCIPNGEPSYESPMTSDQTKLMIPVDPVGIGRRTYIKTLVCTYDADCSSSFDQEEIYFLLQCLGCSLDENNILYFFPEVRFDSVSFPRIMGHVSAGNRLRWSSSRVRFMGRGARIPASLSVGFFYTRKKSLAKNILIARCRQQAKERTEEAKVLSEIGSIPEKDNSAAITSGCLQYRAQILAMRQIDLFLKTVHGRFQQFICWKHNIEAWSEYMVASEYSHMGAILYAVELHCEYRGQNKEKVCMSSEVAQIIRFLDQVLSIPLDHTKIEKISEIIGSSLLPYRPGIGRDNIGNRLEWLDFRYLVDTLHDATKRDVKLGHLKARKEKDFLEDAIWSMYARARQQACVVAVGEMGVSVVSTNYRCRILAIEKVLENQPSRTKDQKTQKLFDDVIPKESVLLFLLWKGFSFEDIMFDYESEEIVNFSHWDGHLSTDLVDTHMSVKDVKESYMQRTKSSKIGYWAKTNLVPRPLQRRRFIKYLRAIIEQSDNVEAAASEYLSELMSGVSNL